MKLQITLVNQKVNVNKLLKLFVTDLVLVNEQTKNPNQKVRVLLTINRDCLVQFSF